MWPDYRTIFIRQLPLSSDEIISQDNLYMYVFELTIRHIDNYGTCPLTKYHI